MIKTLVFHLQQRAYQHWGEHFVRPDRNLKAVLLGQMSYKNIVTVIDSDLPHIELSLLQNGKKSEKTPQKNK